MSESKTKREREKLRRIVEAAERLFCERGIAETSMDDVAEAVPVAKMTLYKYVSSKERLLDLVLDGLMERGRNDFLDMLERSPSPLEAFQRLAQYRGMDHMNGVFIRDLMRLYPEKGERVVAEQQHTITPIIEKLFFEGQQRGQFRKDLSPHVVLLFMMGLKDFVARADAMGGPLDLRTVGEQLLSILYYGIVATEQV
ncbi:TetR/AcrR family transcriptional regulator [Paenibacillus sp.]|uniref:TetR/AcrR family transcriptional regulator n=1 Tax=Paenibacillus sp. TaxID=58172 RepID=UPI002D6BA719|nr:TetR/AcrR family transcriptional regulator [Paenibacillus sp.]HZG55415.1 TetR/AcrR family transcriptional regulator [Paenibacillus sp.]